MQFSPAVYFGTAVLAAALLYGCSHNEKRKDFPSSSSSISGDTFLMAVKKS